MRWSNSAIYTMQQCGERFRRRYIERDFRPMGVAAKRGIALHRVAAESHMRQLRAKENGRPREEYLTGTLPTVEEAKDIAADTYQQAVAEGVALSDDEKSIGAAKTIAAMKDEAVSMGAHYVQRIAPEIDPVGVERRIVITPADLKVEIQGIVDLVAEQRKIPTELDFSIAPGVRRVRLAGDEPEPMDEVIHDLKSANKMPRAEAVDSNQQLTLYALLRAAEVGRAPEKVRLTTVVSGAKGVSHVIQTGDRTPEDLSAVAKRVMTAISAAEAGIFVPANPDSWWCSAKYCEFFSECAFAIGKRR